MKNLIFLNLIKNIFLIKNKIVFIIIINKKKSILLQEKNIWINKNYNWIKIKNNYITKILNNLLKKLNSFFIEKIIFNGKGFKIKKIKKICYFLFNKSHPIINLEKITKTLKINKNNLIIVEKKFKKEKKMKIKKIFPLNKFTRKGIRYSEQIVNIKKK